MSGGRRSRRAEPSTELEQWISRFMLGIYRVAGQGSFLTAKGRWSATGGGHRRSVKVSAGVLPATPMPL